MQKSKRNRNAGKHPSYKKRKMSKKQIENKRKYDKKYASTKKAKKYRAELNRENRKRGTYGNGDGKDLAHTKNGLKKQSQSKNRANNRPKKKQTRAPKKKR